MPDTYEAKADCINCGHVDTYTVEKGTQVKHVPCKNCGCEGTLVRALLEKLVRITPET